MRVPTARTLDSVRELVAWTYYVDLFHGLTLGERQRLCLEARGELVRRVVYRQTTIGLMINAR
jgi:hypothetical protein